MWLEWLIQFGPIFLFFIIFEISAKDFFLATTFLIGSTVIAVFADYWRSQRFALFPIFSSLFTVLFGGATLYFHNPQFLMVKDTIYYLIFASGLLISFALGKNLLCVFFDSLIAMSSRGWKILAWRWTVFFLLAALLNEFVRRSFSEEIWVHYKLASVIVFIAFGFYQFTLTKRERIVEQSNGFGLRIRKPIVPAP